MIGSNRPVEPMVVGHQCVHWNRIRGVTANGIGGEIFLIVANAVAAVHMMIPGQPTLFWFPFTRILHRAGRQEQYDTGGDRGSY